MDNGPVVIERVFNAPIDKVWKAISDKNQMKQWYFQVSDFRPKAGFEFSFEGGNEGKTFIHLCTVTEVITGRKLSYSLRYKGYEGDSLVIFALFAEGSKTRLKLTHTGLDTFPQTSDFLKSNFVQGWTIIIGTSLSVYLGKS